MKARIAAATALAAAATVLATQNVLASDSFIVGWQTFSNCSDTNNSGICDTYPQSNATFDATPVGPIGPDDLYLTAAIGPEASSIGRKGRGQNISNEFLNGDGFGQEEGDTDRLIINVPLADGSPGERIGPYGDPVKGAPDGTSSWKFSSSDFERTGDVRLTNHSQYYFKLTFLNFDARVGNENSPHNLQIKYLSGDDTIYDNNLTKKSTGTELNNLVSVYNKDFLAEKGAHNVSRSVGEAIDGQVYIPPGGSAAFRLFWTDQATDGAESQIDNFAFQGNFYETSELLVEVDPVPEPNGTLLAIAALGCIGLLAALRRRSRR